MITNNHEPWRRKAECADKSVKVPPMMGAWDGPNEDGERHPMHYAAREICLTGCPVQLECLKDAVQDPEAQGLRGGYEFDGGKVPVGVAREIALTHGITFSEWQSMGRPKRPKSDGPSSYL